MIADRSAEVPVVAGLGILTVVGGDAGQIDHVEVKTAVSAPRAEAKIVVGHRAPSWGAVHAEMRGHTIGVTGDRHERPGGGGDVASTHPGEENWTDLCGAEPGAARLEDCAV